MALAFDHAAVPMQPNVVAGCNGTRKAQSRRHQRLRTTGSHKEPYREILMGLRELLFLLYQEVVIPGNCRTASQISPEKRRFREHCIQRKETAQRVAAEDAPRSVHSVIRLRERNDLCSQKFQKLRTVP